MKKSMVKDWRAWLSEILILLGLAAMIGAALFWVKTALAAEYIKNRTYLMSNVDHRLPLPNEIHALRSTEVLHPPKGNPAKFSAKAEVNEEKTLIFPILLSSFGGNAEFQSQEADATPIEIPKQLASTGPIVRLVIPRLDIDSAVIPIGWNTEKLFASQNRTDLVGHLKTSVNPGSGSNVVLVGHNYNNTGHNWTGVFHDLKDLKPGDKIKVYTQNGGKHIYKVKKVKQLPWNGNKGLELDKHLGYLWPKPHEQLTLITCGGDFLRTWSARVYVVALPVEN
jgi:LPXTG-site transpeptidase (sortase) family protein